jgi:hypothetical protein
MGCLRQRSGRKTYAYLSEACTGYAPLSVGRTTKGRAQLVRAERLDTLGWDALAPWLHPPRGIPPLPQTWAEAQQPRLSGLEAHHAPRLQRRQRMARQAQRLLAAYQAASLTLHALPARRPKRAAALHQMAQESPHGAHPRPQRLHGQHGIDPTATLRPLLGEPRAQLSFEERQAIAQWLIRQVSVTGDAVAIQFLLPFATTPQAPRRLPKEPERTPGHLYRLRLAHFKGVAVVPTRGR